MREQDLRSTASRFSTALAEACAGREKHADSFAIEAKRDDAGGALLFWTDSHTGQFGQLGRVERPRLKEVIGELFTQLRAWRQRCEGGAR